MQPTVIIDTVNKLPRPLRNFLRVILGLVNVVDELDGVQATPWTPQVGATSHPRLHLLSRSHVVQLMAKTRPSPVEPARFQQAGSLICHVLGQTRSTD